MAPVPLVARTKGVARPACQRGSYGLALRWYQPGRRKPFSPGYTVWKLGRVPPLSKNQRLIVVSNLLGARLQGWLAGGPAKMAATNKCLARSNKSRTGGKATKP
jgi:hypothetical protein